MTTLRATILAKFELKMSVQTVNGPLRSLKVITVALSLSISTYLAKRRKTEVTKNMNKNN